VYRLREDGDQLPGLALDVLDLDDHGADS